MTLEIAAPKPKPRFWGPMATIGWGVVIFILFLFIQALVLLGFFISTATGEETSEQMLEMAEALENDGLFLSLSTCATALICCPVILGIAKLKRGSNLKDYLGLMLPERGQVWRWLMVVVAFCVAFDVVTFLLKRPIVPEFMTKAYASMESPWILCLAVIVAAPLFEELFFRGFLIRGLAESRVRWQGAVLISSVFWAVIHVQYDAYYMVSVFILGLILGTARVKSGSTALAFLLHALVNLAATVEVVLSLRSA